MADSADEDLLSICRRIASDNKRRMEIITNASIQANSQEDRELGSIGASIGAAVLLLMGLAATTIQGLAAKAAVYKMWEDDALAASIIDDVLAVCSAKALELA